MNDLEKFEEFFTEHPALITIFLVLGIFVCSLVVGGIKTAFVVLGVLLTIVLIAYWVARGND